MTVLSSLREVRASVENPATPLTGANLVELFGGGSKSKAGTGVTEVKSLGVSGVWRAVTLVSGVAAGLPLHAFDKTGAERTKATGWQADILDDPNPDMTPFEFWETVYSHILLWGNAYVRVLRDQVGVVRELWPIHPSRVKAGRTSDTGKKIYQIDGGEEPYDDRTILHLPGWGYDGVCGVSPIRMAREAVGLAIAAEEYGGSLFANGSLATGVLQVEQRLTPDQADTLQRRWKAKRAGMSGGETIILDRGAKFQQLSIPPEDAQFLQSRSFSVNEFSRWFGVPPFLMFLTEKSTSWGTGLEQQAIGWVVFDLQSRWTRRVEQRVTKLFRTDRRGARDRNVTVYGKYNLEGLLRGDSKARAEFYKSMWEIGAYSTNDILAKEDEPPVEGGDVRYRPLNFGVLGTGDDDSDNAGGAPASGADGEPADLTDGDVARNVVEMIQKVYLGVGVVLTDEEARELLNRAGANLAPGAVPSVTSPEPAEPADPADPVQPEPQPDEQQQTEEETVDA